MVPGMWLMLDNEQVVHGEGDQQSPSSGHQGKD